MSTESTLPPFECDIVRCDYRGNEPSEQMIARLALADLDRSRR